MLLVAENHSADFGNNILLPDIFLLAGALAFGLLLLNPKLMNKPVWRATVTPLASIIGSGFLVAAPILTHVAGNLAWAAMLGLCVLAWGFGGVMRYNIAHLEPDLAIPGSRFKIIERASDLILTCAYFISIAYYLHLFAAFGLRLGGIVDPSMIRILASIVIASLGLLGGLGGLKALEKIEVPAVGIKLSLIAGLILAMLIAPLEQNALANADIYSGLHHDEIPILLGLLILVQGFETSRYLGEEYERKLRIRTMIYAQVISTVIYLVFIYLASPRLPSDLPTQGAETAIIDMLSTIGVLASPLVILAALTSQASAAIGDMNGASGLLAEFGGGRFSKLITHFLIAIVAISIIWMTDIYGIITYASKFFVAYYALQAFEASWLALHRGEYRKGSLFIALIVIGLVILFLAEPISA